MKLFLGITVVVSVIWVSSKIIGCSFTKGVFKPGLLTPGGYHVRDQRVYYYGGLMNASIRELPGVDAASFELLKEVKPSPESIISSAYARDHSQVYYAGYVIPGADPATFEVTGFHQGRDKNHIYDQLRPFSDDPAHFRHLADQLYIDSDHIYWGTVAISDEPDNLKFTIAADSASLTYYADSKGVFASNGMRMPDVDPLTFRPLSGLYSADARHVYVFDVLELKVVQGADPATFHPAKAIAEK